MIPDFSTLEMQTLHSEPLENVKGEAFNTPEQIDVLRYTTQQDISEVDFLNTWPGFPPYLSCLLYTSPSPRDRTRSRMPSSA